MAITFAETVQVVLDLVRQKEEAEGTVKQLKEFINQREEKVKWLEERIRFLEAQTADIVNGAHGVRETDGIEGIKGVD